MTRLPDSKIGVAVFSNDDDHGSSFVEIIKYRIIDAALGLPAIDWNTRYKNIAQITFDAFQSKLVPRPPSPSSPPVPFESLTGSYTHGGYGGLELCLLGGPEQSRSCQEVIDELPTVLPGAVNSRVPTLIAKWDRFWSTHVKLEHFDGPLFNLTALESRPIDDRESDESYWTVNPIFGEGVITAQFVTNGGEDGRVDGFGIFGGLWGSGPLVEDSTDGSSREAAEVFFDKEVMQPVSPQLSQILTPEIDDFIEGVLSSWNSPGGVSVAVAKLDEPEGPWRVETKGYGIANLHGGKPMTEDTLVCIASNSKHFTTLATGLLISDKNLPTPITWDTKLRSILGDLWELQDPIATAHSTIIDAMSHRTGLPRHDHMYTRNDTTVSILKRLRHLKPSCEFREAWQYNNNMYTVLSHLPTVLHPSRPSFARYVKEHIFDPLGLESTTYSPRVARDSGNLADALAREGVNKSEDLFGKGKPRVVRFPGWFLDEGEDGSFKSGAGGVIMNARDAATWLQVLLLEGKDPRTGEEVIPEDAIRKIASGITVQTAAPSFPELSPVVYGGGQARSTYRGHNLIEHGGATTGEKIPEEITTDPDSFPCSDSGYRTQMTRLPDSKLGVAVFSNDDDHGSSFIEVIKYRIIDAALGLPAIDWDTRYKNKAQKAFDDFRSKLVPRPPNPAPPPVPYESLAGIYTNGGYGGLELCLLGGSNQSRSCQEVIDELSTVLPGAVDSTIPTLIAKWDRFWTTHVKLEHFDGPLFNLTALESRPIDDRESDEPYWTADPFFGGGVITAQFVTSGSEDERVVGLGIYGGLWGSGPQVEDSKDGGSREAAEAFFDKVN
ncbi:hypothetical protein PQX77_004099 [Marasmius sp. AFHP31]|nr:hypothetical protein PQX77_004099 [Marasmius sp. AFHP31]